MGQGAEDETPEFEFGGVEVSRMGIHVTIAELAEHVEKARRIGVGLLERIVPIIGPEITMVLPLNRGATFFVGTAIGGSLLKSSDDFGLNGGDGSER